MYLVNYLNNYEISQDPAGCPFLLPPSRRSVPGCLWPKVQGPRTAFWGMDGLGQLAALADLACDDDDDDDSQKTPTRPSTKILPAGAVQKRGL